MTEIWHNPRCSKSRETLALLRARGIAPTIRLYLTDAPSEAEIRAALKALDGPAIALVRTGDALFKELGLTTHSDDNRLIAAMAAHPALIERPLVLHAGRAALGRPPESALALF
ncbi:Arsenate reductase [Defluviimonas aquaemixtae]|uniref:Arsenate reductase n=1 Tax=Albidovulum aquaemixtae TaxID=1542388 RepID=A0A2R8B3G2_9RHOB|nr:arsenate reductase (glutaredoxin) [Defluviimonas aquaemixtae]SPH17156.1 Arsenate reductase [Defluviimonas aquaemixtae]